jgi:hypothetical protein
MSCVTLDKASTSLNVPLHQMEINVPTLQVIGGYSLNPEGEKGLGTDLGLHKYSWA